MNLKNSLLLFISVSCLFSCNGNSNEEPKSEEPKSEEPKSEEPKRDFLKEILEKQSELSELNEEVLKTRDGASCRSLMSQKHKLDEEIANLKQEAKGVKGHVSILYGTFCTDTGYSPPDWYK